MEVTDGLSNTDLVTGRKKKKRKAWNEVGKESEKSDVAEESNNRIASKLVHMVQDNWEKVTSVKLEKW